MPIPTSKACVTRMHGVWLCIPRRGDQDGSGYDLYNGLVVFLLGQEVSFLVEQTS